MALLDRRNLIRSAAGAAAGAFAGRAAFADSYPSRPIKLIVPFAAGGPTDLIGRAIGDFLARDLRQPVIVENKPGANANVAAEQFVQADPDGYTLFIAQPPTLVLNPVLYPRLRYDPSDIRLIALVTEVPFVMVVNPRLEARSVRDFVAYANANRGNVNYGSSGVGSSAHLGTELFKLATGVDMTHVPYRGLAPALSDLIGGQIEVLLDTVSTSLPHIRGGTIRPLAVTTPERVATLPDVPTMAESGYPDVQITTGFGPAAPARTPEPIAAILTRSMNKAMEDAGFRASLERLNNIVLRPREPAALASFLLSERERWTRVIRAGNITLE